MQLMVRKDGTLQWPTPDAIVLVTTDAAGYGNAVLRLAAALSETGGSGVFVTANRPAGILREHLDKAGIAPDTFLFVDCVSAMTGVLPAPEPGVTYIESPTMLEKIAMRAEQVLRRVEGPPFLVIDSLSTLTVYNGIEAVSELVHTLVTRLRLQRMGAALLLVDKQVGPELAEAVQPLCDGTVRLDGLGSPS